jgi:hypothetical protein
MAVPRIAGSAVHARDAELKALRFYIRAISDYLRVIGAGIRWCP